MKETQDEIGKRKRRPPSGFSTLLKVKYPDADDLVADGKPEKAKDFIEKSENASEVAEPLREEYDQSRESHEEGLVCSTLDLAGQSSQTAVKPVKPDEPEKVKNNFQGITNTRARNPGNTLSLEAAAGFLWQSRSKKEEKVRDFHSHIGEEVIFVRSGELRYRDILGNNLVIEEKDVLRYRSELLHEVSSMSEKPVESIVIWWGPDFRGSVLRIERCGGLYDQPETWARADTPITLEIKKSTPERILKGARKFCLGMPAMISCKMDAMGISHESLANMIKRSTRYINELLNGFLDPSLEVISEISKHLNLQADHLIWRADDHENWIQPLTSNEYRQNKNFDEGVISVQYLKIGVSGDKFEHEIIKNKSDRIFIVLEGGLNLQRMDLYKENSKDIAATAGSNEAIYLRGGHDCVLFPIHKDVEVLDVSVSDHATKLEEWLKEKIMLTYSGEEKNVKQI